MVSGQKCGFVKADGTACRAAATASGYCFFHDGHKAAEAGRKGGKRSRKRPVILPVDAEADVPLATVADVTRALAATFNDVRRQTLDAKTGNCLGLLAGQLLKAFVGCQIADEFADLKREIETLRDARNPAATNPEGPSAASEAETSAPADGGDDDAGADQPGPVEGEPLAGEMEAGASPLFPPGWQEPGSRSSGTG